MYRHTTWFVIAFSSVFLQATGFSLYDREASYSRFERWPLSGQHKNAVSLRFKTYEKTGLLFYVDDEGNSQYLAIYLRDGFLVLDLRDKLRDFNDVSKKRVNDLQWHKLTLELTSQRVVYKLDKLTQTVFNTSTLRLQSDVYIGGLPNSVGITQVSNMQVVFEDRFLGCVEDVRYVNHSLGRPAIMLEYSAVGKTCKDACKPVNPCRNHGVCVNKFAVTECLCAGTGFWGETCSKELPAIGFPTIYDRVIIDMPSGPVANLDSTTVSVRFRSARLHGVFFYTAYRGDYILLELTNGKVSATVNLGSGSATVTTKNNRYDDNQWHTVKLQRLKRTVNLTVDSSDSSEAETQGNFYRLNLPRLKVSFVFGGLSDTRPKIKSESKKNFTGCLQEFIFNDFELFSKLRNSSVTDVRPRGTIFQTCPMESFSTEASLETTSVFQSTVKTARSTTTDTFSTTGGLLSSISPETGLKNLSKNDTDSTDESKKGWSCGSSSCKPATVSEPFTDVSSSPTGNSPPEVIPPATLGAPTIFTTTSSETENKDILSTVASAVSTDPKSVPEDPLANIEPVVTQRTLSSNDGKLSRTFWPRTTDEVIMASKNERREGDLTLWFVLAAGIGILAFVLVIAVILKVNAANRMKYEIRQAKYNVYHSGSFQRSNNNSKNLV